MERKEFTTVLYLTQAMLLRHYTLECIQKTLVSGACIQLLLSNAHAAGK